MDGEGLPGLLFRILLYGLLRHDSLITMFLKDKMNPSIAFSHKMVSIIVPVLNESKIINRTAEHLLSASRGCNAEIIIVDGDPDGSSIRDIELAGIQTMVGPKGRGHQMNAGARAASGSIFLFVHADTCLPQDAVFAVLNACRRPGIAGGAFLLGIDNHRRIYRLIEAWANLRSRLLAMPYGDQAIFVKKSVFEKIGGYAMIPIMEDIDIMNRLKRGGYTISLIKTPVRTSARRWEAEGPAYTILRNNLLSTMFCMGLDASLLKRFYR